MTIRSWGPSFQVNVTTAEDQRDPDVVVLSDGRVAIAYEDQSPESGERILARLFDSDGAPAGDEVVLFDNAGDAGNPALAATPSGDFIFVNGFDEFDRDFTNVGFYDVDAQIVSNIDQLAGARPDQEPSVAFSPLENQFNVVDTVRDGLSTRIFSTVYVAPSGETSYADLRFAPVSSEDLNAEITPDIAYFDQTGPLAGSYVVVWRNGSDIYFRRFLGDFTPLDPQDVLVASSSATTINPEVIALENGGFLITYNDSGRFPGSETDVWARLYAPDGTFSTEILLNQAVSGDQLSAATAALPNGGFLAVFADSASAEVRAQKFDRDGRPVGSEFRVADDLAGFGDEIDVAVLDDGRVIVAWAETADPSGPGAGLDVRAAILDPRDGNVNGSAASDEIFGSYIADDMRGLGGRDTLYGLAGIDFIQGGGENDLIFGGAGGDSLFGGANSDEVYGEAGDDFAEGGSSNDTIGGGAGDDTLMGGAGRDRLQGAAGADSLVGNAGDDSLLGSDGADTLNGGGNEDTLRGGPGDDSLFGAFGNDLLSGDLGRDTLDGSDGRDTLEGGDGDDVLIGGPSLDMLFGGDGADSLSGNVGNDTLNGGAGADTLVGASGSDSLQGGGDDDALFGGDNDDTLLGASGADALSGGGGGDLLVGNDGDDTLDGDAGSDTLEGSNGEDLLIGGGGQDALLGGGRDDTLMGGGAADQLNGGNGDDQLEGGSGADQLIGGGGDDRLEGGSGGDEFVFSVLDADFGADVVVDFTPGSDRLTFAAGGGGAPDDLLSFQQQGADLVIRLDTGAQVTVLDVTRSEIEDDIFVIG